MLIGCFERTACPTMERSSIATVNSLKSMTIESFCDSMKWSIFFGDGWDPVGPTLLFHHVDASGIRPRHLPAFLEDDSQQLLMSRSEASAREVATSSASS